MAKDNLGLDGPEPAVWLKRVEAELDNLRAAMALALAEGVDPVIAVKFAVALQGFWILRSYATEGRRLVKAALARPAVESSSLAKAHALYVGAVLAESQSDHPEARRMLEICLALRRELGDPQSTAATLAILSSARLQAGDAVGAGADENEALELFRQGGDHDGEAISLLHLGQIAIYEANHELARSYLQQSLTIARRLERREVVADCELTLGEVDLEEGNATAAREHFDRSLTVCREAANKRGEANALWWLGKADLHACNARGARPQLVEALKEFRAADMWKELLGCLEDHAVLAHLEGSAEAAVRIAATATVARQRLGLAHSPLAEQHWQDSLVALRASLSTEAFGAAWKEACDLWQVEDAVRTALTADRRSGAKPALK